MDEYYNMMRMNEEIMERKDEEEIYNSEESFEDDYDEYLEVNKAVSNNKKYNKNKSRKKRSKKEKRNSKTNV